MAWDEKEPRPIRLARMMAMTPEALYNELQEYGRSLVRDRGDTEDDELEKALLSRNNSLINLALAQYGGSKDVLTTLYNSDQGDDTAKLALRIAVLGNRVHPEGIEAIFSKGFGVIGNDEVRRISEAGSGDEIRAMFLNPSAKRLISKLYLREPPFDAISDDRFYSLVELTSENPCIRNDESDREGPDMEMWDIQKGVLTMLQTAPVNEDTLQTMASVVANLNPAQARIPDKDPGPMIDRWIAVKVSEKGAEFLQYMGVTELPFKGEFCVLLAAIYGRYWADKNVISIGSLDSPDVVKRCAFYGSQKMTAVQMRAAHDRDKDAFTLAALCNVSLLRNMETRIALEECLRGGLFYRYRKRCEELKARWSDFEMGPVTETVKETWADELPKPSEEQKSLTRVERRLLNMELRILKLSTKVQWMLLGTIAVLAILVWRVHL